MLDGHLAGKPFLHVLAIIADACRCAKASNAEAVGGGLGNSIDESIASGADVDDEPVATIFSPKSFGATDLLNLDSDELAADGDETWSG